MRKSSFSFLSVVAFLAAFGVSGWLQAACVDRGFSGTEQKVMDAYIAYYGRPADPAGLAWWKDELDKAGGDLSAIIDAFGNSQEFTDRYGGLSESELVNTMYQQILGRDADAGGLEWYTGQLSSGAESLQKITLAILGGVQGEDVSTVENRRAAAKHFVTQMEVNTGLSVSDDLYNTLLASVSGDDSTAESACALVDSTLLALGGTLYSGSDDNGGDDNGSTPTPSQSGIIAQGSGSCETLAWPAVGASMSAQVTTYVEGQDPGTMSMSMTVTESTGSVLGVRTEQSGSEQGFSVTSTSDTRTTFSVRDGAYWTSKVEITAESSSSGITATTQTTITNAEEEYGTPVTVCQGMKWYSAPVTYTSVSQTTSSGISLPETTVTDKTTGTTSEVLAMNESVTVPAGTFSTIKIKTTDDDGAYSIVWLINGKWFVKQETYDKSGKLLSLIEATQVAI